MNVEILFEYWEAILKFSKEYPQMFSAMVNVMVGSLTATVALFGVYLPLTRNRKTQEEKNEQDRQERFDNLWAKLVIKDIEIPEVAVNKCKFSSIKDEELRFVIVQLLNFFNATYTKSKYKYSEYWQDKFKHTFKNPLFLSAWFKHKKSFSSKFNKEVSIYKTEVLKSTKRTAKRKKIDPKGKTNKENRQRAVEKPN